MIPERKDNRPGVLLKPAVGDKYLRTLEVSLLRYVEQMAREFADDNIHLHPSESWNSLEEEEEEADFRGADCPGKLAMSGQWQQPFRVV